MLGQIRAALFNDGLERGETFLFWKALTLSLSDADEHRAEQGTMDHFFKNEMRCSQQAESSAIRFPLKSRSSLQDGDQSMYTLKSPGLYPDDQLAVSRSPVSTGIVYTILTFRRTRRR
jgi:hypothetical protein